MASGYCTSVQLNFFLVFRWFWVSSIQISGGISDWRRRVMNFFIFLNCFFNGLLIYFLIFFSFLGGFRLDYSYLRLKMESGFLNGRDRFVGIFFIIIYFLLEILIINNISNYYNIMNVMLNIYLIALIYNGK